MMQDIGDERFRLHCHGAVSHGAGCRLLCFRSLLVAVMLHAWHLIVGRLAALARLRRLLCEYYARPERRNEHDSKAQEPRDASGQHFHPRFQAFGSYEKHRGKSGGKAKCEEVFLAKAGYLKGELRATPGLFSRAFPSS